MIAARQIFLGRDCSIAPTDKYILRLKDGIDLRSDVNFPDGDFTLAFWFKGYSMGVNGIWHFGWADRGWGGSRSFWDSSTLTFRYATGSAQTSFSIPSLGQYATDGQWHHFAYRRNGSTVSAICDGVNVLNASVTALHKNDGVPMSIGSIGNDSNNNWGRGDKSIGFFCLFNRALSDTELSQLAAARSLQSDGGFFTSLVCGYELSSDTLLGDVTGNHPLTLYNKSGETVEYSDLLPRY